MIKFEQVTLKNFKSFGNKPQTLRLDDVGTTLIVGNNEDIGEKGMSANGVGKSNVLSAVIFALYNKDLDKLKPDELINIRNEKGMRIELLFSIGGHAYKIIRGRKPNILEFYEDDVSLTRDSMKNTDLEVQRIIGVSYDVFMSVFFANPFKETFMSMGAAAQRNFMEDVLSLDTLAERAESLKNIRKDLRIDIKLAEKDYEHALNTYEKEKERHEYLQNKQQTHEEEREEKIAELHECLDVVNQIDFDDVIQTLEGTKTPEEAYQAYKHAADILDGYEREYQSIGRTIQLYKDGDKKYAQWEEDHVSAIDTLEEDVKSAPSIEEVEERDRLSELVYNLEQKALQLSDRQRTINTVDIPAIDEKIDKLGDEFSTLEGGECPYCHQSHTDDKRMDAILEEFSSLDEKKNSLSEKLESLSDEQVGVLEETDKTKASIPDIPRDVKKHDVERLYERLEDEQNKTNPHTKGEDTTSLEEEQEGLEEKINTMKESVDEKKDSHMRAKEEYETMTKNIMDIVGTVSVEDIRGMKSEASRIQEEIRHVKKAPNPYTGQLQDFPDIEEVSDEELKFLRAKEEHSTYLIRLLTDPKSFIRKNIVDQYIPFLNKKIVEYTQYLDLPHVAEINSDMTVDVEYMRKNVSYFTLSRGERLRLDLATTLAFRDLMKMMGKETNLMLVDEVLDSALDQHGKRKAFDIIKNYVDNVMLISHREEFRDMVDGVLVITKRNGFSIIDDGGSEQQ